MADQDLVLGPDPGSLVVRVVRGERMTAGLVLSDADSGDPVAWPEAPDMEFEGFTATATLSPSAAPLTVVADALATWEVTPEQTATLSTLDAVRIRVQDETWWSGRVSCQS